MRIGGKAVITLASLLLLGFVLQAIHPTASGNGMASGVSAAMDTPEPVLIQSDNDFITQGWPGNGSSVNPFVIEGLHFHSMQRPYVNISNVDSYFVIRSCEFVIEYSSGASPVSVALLNLSQFLIANSTFNQGFVYVRNSTTCAFRGNNLTSNVRIEVSFCDGLELTDNHIAFSGEPINTWNCGNLTAKGNELVGDGYFPADFEDIFEFSHNRILGDLYFSLYAAFINISYNTFAKALVTSVQGLIDDSSRTMIISHNNFTTGGILFSRDSSPYIRGLFDLSGNYLAGQLIPFMNGLHSQVIDCSGYPEVIAYNCSDIILSGGESYQAATGTAALRCRNVTILNAVQGECNTGIFLQDCYGSTVKDSMTSRCGTGIAMTNCSMSYIFDCHLVDGSTGISLHNADNITIVFNWLFRNDYGVKIEFCSGLLVYGNGFDRNRQSVFYDFYASPFDRWDDGKGDGNSWTDYFGVGSYVVSIMPGWTVADHYPRSLLNWEARPVAFVYTVLLTFILAMIVCVPSAYILSARRKGALAKAMTSRNNRLLIVSFVWLLVPPFAFMIEFSDYIGTTIVVSSMSYFVWYDLGWVYASPTLFTLSGYSMYSIAFLLQILCIALLFALVGIAWNDKKRGQHRKLASNPVLWTTVVYGLFALFLRGTPYGMWFNPPGIPIPISPILVYLTLRRVVLEAPHPVKDDFRRTTGTATLCPYCGASYVYPKDRVAADGTLECQNCAKRFKPGGSPNHRDRSQIGVSVSDDA